MRIACVNYEPVSTYRAQGWSCERLARYYNPAQIATEVCVFAYGDEDWQASPAVRVSGYESLRDLQQKCQQFRPDVIRCYEAFRPNCDHALITATHLDVPSYISFHDARLQYHDQIARYTVITAYTEPLAKRAAGQLRRPVEVQLNGIDSRLFRPQAPRSIDSRVADARYRIFTVMRADRVKNVDTVVAATTILATQLASVAHVLAGPGSEAVPFDGVHLGLGPTSEHDIVAYLNWCTCFLQVQLVGDIGMAAAEALMVGRPIVTTGDSSGNAQRHVNAGNGVLVPIEHVRDAESVASAVATCLQRSYDSARIRQAAIETYDADLLQRREADRYKRIVGLRSSAQAQPDRPLGGRTSHLRALQLRAELAVGDLRQRVCSRLNLNRRAFVKNCPDILL